jgi:hypothetical protein
MSAEKLLNGSVNMFGQTITLDPSFFSVDDDVTALGNAIDEFMTGTVPSGLSQFVV